MFFERARSYKVMLFGDRWLLWSDACSFQKDLFPLIVKMSWPETPFLDRCETFHFNHGQLISTIALMLLVALHRIDKERGDVDCFAVEHCPDSTYSRSRWATRKYYYISIELIDVPLTIAESNLFWRHSQRRSTSLQVSWEILTTRYSVHYIWHQWHPLHVETCMSIESSSPTNSTSNSCTDTSVLDRYRTTFIRRCITRPKRRCI